MTKCSKCGAEYTSGPGGWAGLCRSCIEKLAGESKPRKPEAIITSNITPSIPESPKPKLEPRTLSQRVLSKLGRWPPE